MKGIQWDADGYYINGERKPLISGEMHYFRVPREDWKYRLKLLREAGANCVGTYAPWIVHEPAEGKICFDDCAGRELTAYLQFCKEEDMPVIVRPGPYQYSELVWGGLPDWLIKGYPEIMAATVDGKPMAPGTVSYLHPVFLKKAREYYRAINRIIKQFLVENGGTVCMVQPDNELTGVHIWSGSLDYNPVTMGFGTDNGRYPQWLLNKYGSIEELNQAYNRSYPSFAEVYPIDKGGDCSRADAYEGGDPVDEASARRIKDYYEFYCSTIREYLQVLIGWFREDGITAPVCHNAAGTGMIPHFLEASDQLKEEHFVLGVDHYYTLGPTWPRNHPTPQYALSVLMSLDFLKSMHYPPTVFELQGGNYADFPPMLREDCKACYMTNTALGMKGMSYYIFTGGANFGETGSTGKVYDFNSMVSPTNEIRPTYYAMKEHNEFVLSHTWLQDAQRKASVTIGYTWEGQQCEYHDCPNQLFSGMSAWEYLRDGLLFTLMGSPLAPELSELGDELPLDRPLIVPCSDTMSRMKQQRLIDFVKAGGKLLLTPVVPVKDENYHPCTLLKDFLHISEITKIENCNGKLRTAENHIVYQITHQFTCNGMGVGSEILACNYSTGQPVAYKKSFGKGQVIWLGANWNYLIFDHIYFLTELCHQLGGQDIVNSSNLNVWCVLWEREDKAVLFVLNLFSGQQESHIRVFVHGEWKDLGTVKAEAMNVLAIDL